MASAGSPVSNLDKVQLRRYDGDLEPSEPLLKPSPRRSHHPLCPDRKTLDHFLAGLLSFINPQYYKATATLELIPAWLRFLASRQLITADQHQQTLAELRGLATEFGKVVKTHSDPALRTAVLAEYSHPSGGAAK